jgi:hypothetical protein
MLRTTLMRWALVLPLGIAVAVSQAGCQTMKNVKEDYEAGRGVSKTYGVTEDQAWTISRQVLHWEEAEAIEEHRSEGYLSCTFGMNLVSAGSLAAVWIENAFEDGTTVTVVCKRRMATNFATIMTEGKFHRLFAMAVAILKSGRPLPETRPTEVEVQP